MDTLANKLLREELEFTANDLAKRIDGLVKVMKDEFGHFKLPSDFSLTIKPYRDGFILSHRNIVPRSSLGIMGAAISEVDLEMFFSPLKTQPHTWGAFVRLGWEHPGGGSNGYKIGQIWYDTEKDKWTAKYDPRQ